MQELESRNCLDGTVNPRWSISSKWRSLHGGLVYSVGLEAVSVSEVVVRVINGLYSLGPNYCHDQIYTIYEFSHAIVFLVASPFYVSNKRHRESSPLWYHLREGLLNSWLCEHSMCPLSSGGSILKPHNAACIPHATRNDRLHSVSWNYCSTWLLYLTSVEEWEIENAPIEPSSIVQFWIFVLLNFTRTSTYLLMLLSPKYFQPLNITTERI